MTLFEQIGIESKTFVKVHGTRWKSKAVLPLSLATTKFNDCTFVTVCLDKSDSVSPPSVTESCIIEKNDEKLQCVKGLVIERVQLRV